MNFNALPPEAQFQMFKYSPHAQYVTKASYDAYQYYHQFCDLPVTVNEVLAWVAKTHPDRFVIFRESEDVQGTAKLTVYSFFKNDLYKNQFDCNRAILTTGISDYDEYQFEFNENDLRGGIDVDGIKKHFNDLMDPSVFYFDLTTLLKVLSRRTACMNYNNHYAVDWVNAVWLCWIQPIRV